MVRKYVRVLEEKETNIMTGEVWKITDVPNTWRKKVEEQVLSDGYTFAEDCTLVAPL